MKSTTLVLLLVAAFIAISAGPALAVCPSCYWANYWVYKGNVAALEGISRDTGCNGSDVISFNLSVAHDAGVIAEQALWSAYQGCGISDATTGLDKTEEAEYYACVAKTTCQQQCSSNPACEYAIDACRYYGDAIGNATACVYEACPGTAAKWQSDYHLQTPYESPVQPDPIVCLSTDRCQYSTGASAARGHVSGGNWLCSAEAIDGRSQGCWYKCESSRLGLIMEGKDCVYSSGVYSWQ